MIEVWKQIWIFICSLSLLTWPLVPSCPSFLASTALSVFWTYHDFLLVYQAFPSLRASLLRELGSSWVLWTWPTAKSRCPKLYSSSDFLRSFLHSCFRCMLFCSVLTPFMHGGQPRNSFTGKPEIIWWCVSSQFPLLSTSAHPLIFLSVSEMWILILVLPLTGMFWGLREITYMKYLNDMCWASSISCLSPGVGVWTLLQHLGMRVSKENKTWQTQYGWNNTLLP